MKHDRYLIEQAESLYPRRSHFAGWSPPHKETRPMDIDNETRRIEAEQRADNDELERVLTPPPDADAERLIAEAEAEYARRQNVDPDAAYREMQVRAGLVDPDDVALPASSASIARDAERSGWDRAHRRGYLDAVKRERTARQASTSYGGAA